MKHIENTREKILLTAKLVFMEKGFSDTTMRDISSRANINKGLLHYYFQTKKSLFENIIQMTTSELFPRLDNIVSLDLKFEEKLTLIVDEYIEFLIRNPNLPPFIMNEIYHNKEILISVLESTENFPKISKVIGRIISELHKYGYKNDPFNFLINMLSLILYPFMLRPMIQNFAKVEDSEYIYLMRLRKNEIVDTLIKSLKI